MGISKKLAFIIPSYTNSYISMVRPEGELKFWKANFVEGKDFYTSNEGTST